MRTFSTRFIPTAAALAVAVLFGAAAFAQTGASNVLPYGGSKQDPQADNPVIEKTTPAERQAARAKRKAERAAGAGASNALPPAAGSKQDPQADNPVLEKTSPAERQAARAKRKAERAAGGPTASNPANPKSNPTGSAETSVQTSATPQSRN